MTGKKTFEINETDKTAYRVNKPDKKKIILMSEMSIYDSGQGISDRKKLEYFCNDYVYRQNISVRLCSFIGCLIVILFYIMHKIVIDKIDVLTMDYQAELMRVCVFSLIVMIIYSVIGSVVYAVDYQKANKRMKKYLKIIDELSEPQLPQRVGTSDRKPGFTRPS